MGGRKNRQMTARTHWLCDELQRMTHEIRELPEMIRDDVGMKDGLHGITMTRKARLESIDGDGTFDELTFNTFWPLAVSANSWQKRL